MPRFDLALARHGQAAIGIVRAGELARTISRPRSILWSEWRISRLEALYELAFLRFFIAWEMFQEATFYRCLCGHMSRHGQEVPARGKYYKTIRDAELAVLGGHSYKHWYDPSAVATRCQQHVIAGRHETTLSSHLARLQCYAAIRHRIAHGQEDARRKFDGATTMLAGKTYPGSRPGRFLRDVDPGAPTKVRWLHTIAAELSGLAGQIV